MTPEEISARLLRYEAALREIAHGPCAVLLTPEQTTRIMCDMVHTAEKALWHERVLEEGFMPLTKENRPEEYQVVLVKCAIGERHMAYWRSVEARTPYGPSQLYQWYDYALGEGSQRMVEVPEWRPVN